jgi:hypothetical protein
VWTLREHTESSQVRCTDTAGVPVIVGKVAVDIDAIVKEARWDR